MRHSFFPSAATCLALILQVIVNNSAGAAADLDEATLARGRQIRQVLLDAMESAYGHEGHWPDSLAAPAARLTYLKPQDFPEQDQRQWMMCTVIAHESFADHLDGVWVGYADAHLEFARTPAVLEDCRRQIEVVKKAVARFGSVYGPKPDHSPAAKVVTGKRDLVRTIRVVDPEGKPVVGARVGISGEFGDLATPEERVEIWSGGKRVSVRTDEDGKAVLKVQYFFDPDAPRYADESTAGLIVFDEARELIALETVAFKEFGKPSESPREVRLQPACRITGSVISLGMPPGLGGLQRIEACEFRPGAHRIRTVASASAKQQFELLVPPGEYGVLIGGSRTYIGYRYVHVDRQHPLPELLIDKVPYADVAMIGQAAPELSGIREWKNSPPLKLSHLRGKVVVLDFWGEWCGPCVQSMPYLMKLYDKYKDRGLEVIAVHDDSAPSLAEMDRRLAERRKTAWEGRDLPFPIALDGGGQIRVRYSAVTTRGATTAEYGITSFPTTLVIGRDGKVLEQIDVRNENADAKVAAALAGGTGIK